MARNDGPPRRACKQETRPNRLPAEAAAWVRRLKLRPHPEGGWFRETYRSAQSIPASGLPARFGGARAISTAIYFLLPGGAYSAFHRIRSDELWHFHAGDPLTIHVIASDGCLSRIRLGADPRWGARFQASVPAGAWFAAELGPRGRYALVGCTVAPGFDFCDFELAERGALMSAFPRHRALIGRLTRSVIDSTSRSTMRGKSGSRAR